MTRTSVLAVGALLWVAMPAGAGQTPGDASLVDLRTTVRQAQPPPAVQAPPAPPVERPPLRRRGSMVGYIDDAVIGTKVRVRFESGWNNDAPDRAEFFYAKCGCYASLLKPGDDGFDPEAPGPGPGAASRLNFKQAFVQGELAVSDRVSLFAELPLRWIQPQAFIPASIPPTGETFGSQSGLGDLRGGVKFALSSTDDRVVALQLRGFFPTGKAGNGLGTNHATVEPALLMYHRLTDRASIESQAGLWVPIGGSDGVPITVSESFAGNVFFYGIGPAFEVYRGPHVRFAPVVELVGWRVLGGFRSIGVDASDDNIVNLKFGARLSWEGGGSIYAGWGRALTDQRWYRDIFRVEYRHGF